MLPVYNLFVYGSLRSGFRSTAYEYISKYFNFIGEAKAKGQLVDLGAYPAGVPTMHESYIIGELYLIKNPSEFSWAIAQLDDYEGVSVSYDEVQLYRRALAEVTYQNQIVPSWIYWFNGETSDKPIVPSGDFIEYMKSKHT